MQPRPTAIKGSSACFLFAGWLQHRQPPAAAWPQQHGSAAPGCPHTPGALPYVGMCLFVYIECKECILQLLQNNVNYARQASGSGLIFCVIYQQNWNLHFSYLDINVPTKTRVDKLFQFCCKCIGIWILPCCFKSTTKAMAAVPPKIIYHAYFVSLPRSRRSLLKSSICFQVMWLSLVTVFNAIKTSLQLYLGFFSGMLNFKGFLTDRFKRSNYESLLTSFSWCFVQRLSVDAY